MTTIQPPVTYEPSHAAVCLAGLATPVFLVVGAVAWARTVVLALALIGAALGWAPTGRTAGALWSYAALTAALWVVAVVVVRILSSVITGERRARRRPVAAALGFVSTHLWDRAMDRAMNQKKDQA